MIKLLRGKFKTGSKKGGKHEIQKFCRNSKIGLYPKNSEKPFIFLYISNSGCIIRNLYTGMINNIP